MWKKSKASEECYLGHSGLNYMGSINVTSKRETCQNWSDDFPHKVDNSIKDEHFPDGSKAEAKNYCRNPQPTEKQSPWCYVNSKTTVWDYCTICPLKNKDQTSCTLPGNGRLYKGSLSITRGGFKCDFWKSHPDSNYAFPDRSVESARNFCRNPKSASFIAPWCYTTDPASNWDYCDVCLPFRGGVTKKAGKATTNAVPMDGMSLGSCRQWCINFLGCISVEFMKSVKRCYYQPYLQTNEVENEGVDIYIMKRICPKRANNRPGYFTLYPKSIFLNNFVTYAAKDENACDEVCIRFSNCQFTYFANKRCFYSYDFNTAHAVQEFNSEKHLIRCQPDLEPVADNDDVTASPFEEVTVEAAESKEARESLAKLQADERVKPKITTATLISMVVAVVTLVVIGSSIIGCVKTRQLTDLENEKMAERQKSVEHLRSHQRRMTESNGRHKINRSD